MTGVLAVTAGVALAGSPPEFRHAKNLYDYGDYATAIPLLEELVLPGRLQDSTDVMAAHRMLGVAYHQTGRKAEAAREFKSLLYMDPEATLDPFLTPPDVVEFFESVKGDVYARMPDLRERRARERARQQPTTTEPAPGTPGAQAANDAAEPPPVVVRRVRVIPWPVLFVPLGIPQFLMGHWLRGAAVVALALLSPLPNLFFFIVGTLVVWHCINPPTQSGGLSAPSTQQCRPFRNTVYQSDTTRRSLLYILGGAQLLALVLIPLALIVGVVDALILPDLEVVVSETQATPPAESPRQPPAGEPQSPAPSDGEPAPQSASSTASEPDLPDNAPPPRSQPDGTSGGEGGEPP